MTNASFSSPHIIASRNPHFTDYPDESRSRKPVYADLELEGARHSFWEPILCVGVLFFNFTLDFLIADKVHTLDATKQHKYIESGFHYRLWKGIIVFVTVYGCGVAFKHAMATTPC